MNIQEIREYIKRLPLPSDSGVAGVLVIVALGSFFLGRYSHESQGAFGGTKSSGAVILAEPAREVKETLTGASSTPLPQLTDTPIEGGYVASKSGTKYHLPWCPGAKQIKEENKLYFKTKEEAERAGYTPASNCKGI